MEVPFIDLNRQYLSIKEEIDTVIQSVLSSGRFLAGEQVIALEKELAERYKTRHCLAVGSGAQGLEVALRALGTGPGDEVITTAYSWVASAHAISMTGAEVVFCDIDPGTYNLDLYELEKIITPRSKAILPVHLYGRMCDMPGIKNIAAKYGLLVIEDAAQAHLSHYNGDFPGKWSDAAVLSFYPTKQMGAFGDAGAILTNDHKTAENCRRAANHGALFPERDYKFSGTNSRMDELQAAILRVKLKHIESWIERRRQISEIYLNELKGLNEVALPEHFEGHSWYLFTLKVEKRPELVTWLKRNQIGFGINYEYILPRIAPYHSHESFPHAEHASKSVINLPCYPELSDEQVAYVCRKIKDFYS